MSALRPFARDSRGASAAEFALVLPLMLFLLFAIIDVGRFAWAYNKAEKATQVGARWAIATDMVPDGLIDYSFAVSGGVPQGQPVPATAFQGVSCRIEGGEPACKCASEVANACPGATGTCNYPYTPGDRGKLAFRQIVQKMQMMKRDIADSQVVVNYCPSNLGFSGDPNGPDVAPIINVRLDGMRFRPLSLLVFGVSSLPLPSASYSLTMEDGQGDEAHY